MKPNLASRAVAYYELTYGLIGVVYNAYLLACNTEKGTQILLIICFLSLFSILVFLAGVFLYKNSKYGVVLSLLAQALQLAGITVGQLYLKFICGISINIRYAGRDISINHDFLDFASALSWQLPPPDYTGFNIFPLLICFALIYFNYFEYGVNSIE